ncbi:MAG TPA: radical SAM family heme chaperone HemW [Cyclobacteriaceae bacterium]|nr:radical SAM family heme chaperone HemW [Cyclobacteriaceae bacterium]
MAGIYIHIPFCRQACHYCDFHFSVNQRTRPEMIAAIATELHLQKDYLRGERIETVYWGGGTPSLLTGAEINAIQETIRSLHTLSATAEVTLEANPDDLTPASLRELKEAGINRLSIGMQTFDTGQLKSLNRIHSGPVAIKSFYEAREAGFNNISIDLMYSLPGETTADWKRDIRQAITLNPEHISCYSLTIEEKTVFGKWAAAGKLMPGPDDVSAQHLEVLMDELQQAGYEHYEISNFAKPGMRSNHNSNYWHGVTYLGVGPGAHSFNGASRQFNVSNNYVYLKAIQTGSVPFEKEILTRENKINEYLLTSLRTSGGTDLALLKRLHGYDLAKENKEYLSQLLNRKLITLENHILKLTNTGKLLADKISSDLFTA